MFCVNSKLCYPNPNLEVRTVQFYALDPSFSVVFDRSLSVSVLVDKIVGSI